MAVANSVDPATATTVVQIRLITSATGEYSDERLTFTLDASAVLAPGQELRVMRRPRRSGLSAADVGLTFAVGPFGNNEGVAGRLYRTSEPRLPINLADTSGLGSSGTQYTVSSFAGGGAVLSPVAGGADVTVINGPPENAWVDITSEALTSTQRGFISATGGDRTWTVETPCSEFVFGGQAAGGGGAIGDPYITPTAGPLYKLPSQPQTYRLWTDLPGGGDLVVNARVDFLRMDHYRMVAAREAVMGARNGGMGAQAAFMRYVWARSGDAPPVCVDLETLSFVEPVEGRSWDEAVRKHTMRECPDPAPWAPPGTLVGFERVRPGKPDRRGWSPDVQRAYGHIQTETLALELRSAGGRRLRLLCSRYPRDPSVRTGVQVRGAGGRAAEGVLVGRMRKGGVLRRVDDVRRTAVQWDDRQGRAGVDRIQVMGRPSVLRSGNVTVPIRYVRG